MFRLKSKVMPFHGWPVGQVIFTGRNEVLAKIIFLHLSVIHSVHRGGGVTCLVRGGVCLTNPPQDQTPDPPRDQTPPEQTPPRSRHPPGADTPPGSSSLGDTVNARPVRILLECILVFIKVALVFHYK